MIRRELTSGWAVRAANGDDDPIPASVPGCVHTDLLAAGTIPDPYLDDNETRLGWIGRTDWLYTTQLDLSSYADADRVDLVCGGLDTVADVSFAGTVVGSARNQHRSYRFPLSPRSGELAITFSSAYAYAEALRDQLGDLPNAYPEPFNFIRKMACNFGWDWGPTLVTAGIWRPIAIEAWSTARLASVRPLVTVDGGTGVVTVHIELERTQRVDLPLTVEVAGVTSTVTVPAAETTAVVEIRVDDVELWWPRGHGAQPLYELTVSLGDLDQWRRRIGFRTVALDTGDGAFRIVVNDTPVLVKGTNWIPDDCFPSRVDRARYTQRIAQAADANMNLLRIWGGGIYESDDFYDVCDERGILVWQDFLFACAAYPEESPIAEEVEAEARDNVTRLASHPSLVLWNGNNENLWGYEDWGWKQQVGDRTWGRRYYLDLLPRVVAELDPTRPYWPGSPWSGDPAVHPNEQSQGCMHIWDAWNQRDYTVYREYAPRFVAEFGWQALPTYATLRRSISDVPLSPDSPGMAHHQKAIGGNDKLRRGLEPHFPVPQDFDDWHYLTQLNQARAMTVGIEHFRALQPQCWGTIVWQLNDCWPVTSWAAVDGDGRRKPLWHALQRAYRDRLLTFQPRDDGVSLVVCNDTDDPWREDITVARRDFAGETLATQAIQANVPPRTVATFAVELAPDDPTFELLTAGDAHWFFAEDKHCRYPAPEYDAALDGTLLTIRARSLLRDLTILADRLHPDATVDRALVTLLPGESAQFVVHGPEPLDLDTLTRPPVLRCVNQIISVSAAS